MKRRSKYGAVLGTDHEMVATLVSMSVAEGGRPVGMNELAWRRGCTEGKVAIAMKYAMEQGYVVRTSPRSAQGEWRPTQLGINTFRDGAVMPAEPSVDLGGGVEVRGVPQSKLKEEG